MATAAASLASLEVRHPLNESMATMIFCFMATKIIKNRETAK
jgi:hypothetical protein